MDIKGKNVLLKCLILLFCCSSLGQQNTLKHETVVNDQIAPSGKFISFIKLQNQKRVLVVKHTENGKELIFKNIDEPRVLTDQYFLGLNRTENKLIIQNLQNGVLQTEVDISDFRWLCNKNTVLIFNPKEQLIKVKNLKLNKLIADFNYKNYFLINNNQNLIIETPKGKWINYDVLSNQINSINTSDLLGITKNVLWNVDLKQYLFINQDEANLYVYVANTKHNLLEKVTSIPLENEALKTEIDLSFYRFQFLAPNKLAIHIKNKTDILLNGGPEIWLGNKNGKGALEDNRKDYAGLLLVDLENKSTSFKSIEKVNQKYILGKFPNYLYLRTSFDDLTTYEPKASFEFFNVENSSFKAEELKDLNPVTIADFKQFPFIFYFKDQNWNLLDFKKGTISNITNTVEGTFYDTRNEFYLMVDDPIYQPFPVYKNRYIIFNELNDVYFFDTQTKKMSRKTNGYKSDRTYRLAHTTYKTIPSDGVMNSERLIKPEEGILLHWNANFYEREGLSILYDSHSIDLLEDKARYSQMIRKGNYITYFKEKFNQAPVLYLYDIKAKTERLMYASNQWDTEIKNQKSVYIKWNNEAGEKRGAVIRFPIDYDENIRYPALFNVYEQRMQIQNSYISDKRAGNGYNYRDYTRDGYFVIEPDIYYKIEDPGFSAVACVLDAFNYVVEKFNIDRNRVGLIGHSFGGYQTNFILTQTDNFKAAVSSGGVADLSSRYLDMNSDTQKPDMWRLETQQLRMGKSLAEIPEKYIQNSATTHAKNIKTPLLIWTGKDDNQVHWRNSQGWYLLLKRLNKEVNLLMYPNTGHVMMNEEDINDVATKAKSWFDYYLKDIEKPKWLN